MRIHSVILGWVCSGFDQQQLVFRRSSLPVLEAPYLEPTCWTDWKVHLHNNNNLRLADITPRSTNISRTKDDSTHQLGFLAAFLPSSGRILSIIMVDLHCESNTLSTRHRPSSIAIAIHPSSSIHPSIISNTLCFARGASTPAVTYRAFFSNRRGNRSISPTLSHACSL